MLLASATVVVDVITDQHTSHGLSPRHVTGQPWLICHFNSVMPDRRSRSLKSVG